MHLRFVRSSIQEFLKHLHIVCDAITITAKGHPARGIVDVRGGVVILCLHVRSSSLQSRFNLSTSRLEPHEQTAKFIISQQLRPVSFDDLVDNSQRVLREAIPAMIKPKMR